MTETTETPIPRTVEEIKSEYRRRAGTLDFGSGDLLEALSFEDAREFLNEEAVEANWPPADKTVNTRERVLAQMREYADFAWGKVEGHRGISAGRNLDHYISWCWLLGDDEAVAFMRDDANYPQYGAPALAYVCRRYEIPVPDDEGIQRMILGRPCSSGCGGCGS